MAGKGYQNIHNRLRIAMPVPRDDKLRPAQIPDFAHRLQDRKSTDKPGFKVEKDLEEELGDDYIVDLRRDWILENPEERYDKAVEIWEGHNVSDYLHPNAEAMLMKLEEEEAALEAIGFYDDVPISDDEDTKKIRKLGRSIRRKRLLVIQESRRKRRSNKPVTPKRSISRPKTDFVQKMKSLGLEMENAQTKHFANTITKKEKRLVRTRSGLQVGGAAVTPNRAHTLERKVPRNELGFKDKEAMMKSERLLRKSLKQFPYKGQINETDRRIPTKRPKHLFSGKRKMGKTHRR